MERITVVLHRLRLYGPHGNEGFIQLFISKRLIQGLAVALMSMFIPIFIYETTGFEFWIVALFYASINFGYALLLIPGMKITNIVGFSKALTIGIIFSIAAYTILYYANETNIWTLLIPLTLVMICFRIFHWVPYHVDFTVFTKGGSRGRDVSIMFATIAFMGMLGPILAGYIISNSGYDTLFIIGIILLIASAISYLFVPTVNEKFTWTFVETIKNLFSRKFRRVFVGEMANGAEVIVTLVAWPIFLYEILDGNILEIGALSTLIVGVTIVLQLIVGKYLDKKGENKIETLKRGSILYAVGWVVKMFVLSATQVFMVGLYHNIAKIFIKTPYSAILYDMSGEQGHYVDEFTVLREMSVAIGRVLALVVMVGLTFYISVEWTFIIGAVASLLVNAVYRMAH